MNARARYSFLAAGFSTLLPFGMSLTLGQECYWDMNREEEMQDDPQAKLWLLIHLHKKDAEKVRWPDHLLMEHLELPDEEDENEAAGYS